MLRDELLAEIETIAPVVREYASQSEQLGRLAEPIIKAVRQTRLLRFICAHELGGCEADPLTVMEVSEALSRIDGSAGWTLGIIAMRLRLLVRFSPPNRRAGCLAVAYRSSSARSNREIVPPNPSMVVILSMAGGRLAAAFILPIGFWRGR